MEYKSLHSLMTREGEIVGNIIHLESRVNFHKSEIDKATKELEDYNKELHNIRKLLKEYFISISTIE